MSNFNYSRFGITFRWIERYSRNTMIRVLFLALAVYLFILLMNTVTASYKGIPADMQQLTLLRAIRSCGMAYFFWVIISGTWFCQNIKTKQRYGNSRYYNDGRNRGIYSNDGILPIGHIQLGYGLQAIQPHAGDKQQTD